MKPTRLDAYQLLHDGSLALAEVEAVGMRVDVDRLDKTIDKVGQRIEDLIRKQKKDEVWNKWTKVHGAKANMGSRPQLANILYEHMGYESEEKTKTGRPKTDKDTLGGIDHPFVTRFLEIEKLKKLRATYLVGLRREVVDGLIHPVFNLHLVKTFRSSCSNPNFQNIPVRDELSRKLVRSCIVPRKGNVLVEIDYSALEVRIAACYHQDPAMMAYINDPTTDMHRDMACECFLLEQDQVEKEVRFYAKNQFVFPAFYGSYYAQMAPNLWKGVVAGGLKTVGGVPIKQHLAGKGIKRLGACDPKKEPKKGTFESHIKEVERGLWKDRFKVYAKWKRDWYKQYQRSGGFDLLTGFRIDGVYERNAVINYPVQGSAFHCLLWSLIGIMKEIREHNMTSHVIGQVHDSIVADVMEDELEDYLTVAQRVMTVDIRRHWDWIVTPLEIEAEAGSSWYDKKVVKLVA